MAFKIVFQSALRTLWLDPWPADANVHEACYHAGDYAPHYPVPALYHDAAYVQTATMRLIYNPYSPWWISTRR